MSEIWGAHFREGFFFLGGGGGGWRVVRLIIGILRYKKESKLAQVVLPFYGDILKWALSL